MAVQILPGVDQYLRPGIQKLGDTISLFTETDRETQRAIRNMLIENPALIQDFANLEARVPESLKQMGFGPIADLVTKFPESVEQQIARSSREDLVRTGQAEITRGRQEAEFGVEAFNQILGELGLPEDILDAMRSSVGLPSQLEKEKAQREGRLGTAQEPTNLKNAEIAAIYTQNMLDAAEAGQDVSGSVAEFAKAFVNGEADDSTISAIMQHPLLGPQFELQIELLQAEKNANLQRELNMLRQNNPSAAIQREVLMARDLKGSMAEIKRLLDEYPQGVGMQFIGPELINSRIDPEGVRLRAAMASLSSALFHLRSGTAVTANEKARLEPLTPNRFDTPAAIYNKLDELNRFFDEFITNRGGVVERGGSINPASSETVTQEEMEVPTEFSNYNIAPDVTPEEFTRLLDTMIQRGMSVDEIITQMADSFKVIVPKSSGASRSF